VIGPLIAIGIVASQGVAEARADAEYRSYDMFPVRPGDPCCRGR